MTRAKPRRYKCEKGSRRSPIPHTHQYGGRLPPTNTKGRLNAKPFSPLIASFSAHRGSRRISQKIQGVGGSVAARLRILPASLCCGFRSAAPRLRAPGLRVTWRCTLQPHNSKAGAATSYRPAAGLPLRFVNSVAAPLGLARAIDCICSPLAFASSPYPRGAVGPPYCVCVRGREKLGGESS
jgi:hypothetical protein